MDVYKVDLKVEDKEEKDADNMEVSDEDADGTNEDKEEDSPKKTR